MPKCHQNRNRRRRNARREKTRAAEGIHRRKQMFPTNWNYMMLTNYLKPFGGVQVCGNR